MVTKTVTVITWRQQRLIEKMGTLQPGFDEYLWSLNVSKKHRRPDRTKMNHEWCLTLDLVARAEPRLINSHVMGSGIPFHHLLRPNGQSRAAIKGHLCEHRSIETLLIPTIARIWSKSHCQDSLLRVPQQHRHRSKMRRTSWLQAELSMCHQLWRASYRMNKQEAIANLDMLEQDLCVSWFDL